jgi:hypothetical protein
LWKYLFIYLFICFTLLYKLKKGSAQGVFFFFFNYCEVGELAIIQKRLANILAKDRRGKYKKEI